ncbi:hypothetical protein M3Y98_00276900 [Aphelenchoides besseyi]|nr:hypothetical protein M3Y98_00276900 [Aphelenchoides besseyi]KAI6201003.1 hypothetical protein M3Y96_00794800 [Aphelenchoides besseyi]
MNNNVQNSGFAGLSDMEDMRVGDVVNLFVAEILPLNEFASEFFRFHQGNLLMYSDLFRRMYECPSDEMFDHFVLEFYEAAFREMVQFLGKVERTLQSNNDTEHINSELPKSVLDKFWDFNTAMYNWGIPALKYYYRYMSGPKAAAAGA